MDPITARAIVDEFMSQKGLNPPPPQRNIDFTTDLFDKQIDFINDPSKRKAALCSRRAGKSVLAAYYLIKTAYEKPNAKCVFMAITRQSAKNIIWKYLLDINRRYKLGAEISKAELSLTLPNGAKIYITGADKEKEIDKLLGSYFDLCFIDEADKLRKYLDKLVKETLAPSTIDYDGTICMISTPGVICDGLFYDVTTGKAEGWSVHKWTLLENPKLPRKGWNKDPKKIIEEILKKEGIDKGSSIYKREYLGQWVEGAESLVYRFNETTNTFISLPKDTNWNHLIAVDYGSTDPSAILVGAYSFDSPYLHIIREYKGSGQTPQDMANRVKALYNQYNPVSLVLDGNGIGAAFISQMTSMYELPFEIAEKKDKVVFVDLLNDDIVAGKVKIAQECIETITEIKAYQWDNPKLKILPEKAEDHLMDTLLYLWRKSLHFKGKVPEPIPTETDSNYGEFLRDQELQRVRDEANNDWDDNY